MIIEFSDNIEEDFIRKLKDEEKVDSNYSS